MKRLSILAFIVLVGLIVAACAPQTPQTGAEVTPTLDIQEPTTAVAVSTPALEETEAIETTPTTDVTSTPEAEVTTATPLTDATPITDVTGTPEAEVTTATPLTDATPITGTDTVTGTAETADERTIVETAIADGRFTTLVAAIQAAGLEEQLQDIGPYTVFAPTDEAFAALPQGTIETLLANPTLLGDILTYHVVEGDLMASDITGMDAVTTLQGGEISISAEGNTVTLNDTAEVITPDIETSNGVIHVIDSVLLPPGVELPSS